MCVCVFCVAVACLLFSDLEACDKVKYSWEHEHIHVYVATVFLRRYMCSYRCACACLFKYTPHFASPKFSRSRNQDGYEGQLLPG